jgi:hypothetical protein
MLALGLTFFGNSITSFLIKTTNVQYLEAPLSWQATYLAASKVIPKNPYFGSGPNTFAPVWDLIKPAAVNSTVFWNSEINSGIGTIPTTLITAGFVGFVLWVIFYVLVLALALRVLFSFKKDAKFVVGKSIIAFSVLWSTIFMVFYSPGLVFVITHFAFIGLLIAIDDKKWRVWNITINDKQWKYFAAVLSAIVVTAGSVFVFVRIGEKLAAAHYAFLAVKSQNADQSLGYINTSIKLDSKQAAFYQIKSGVYLAKVSQIVASSTSLGSLAVDMKQDFNTDVSGAVQGAVLAQTYDPTNWQSYVFTGRTLEYIGSLGIADASKNAIQSYTYASTLSPTNPLPYLFASNLFLSMGDASSSKAALKEAINLK